MSCTLQVNAATAASGGDLPIGNATYEWKDGGGVRTNGPNNGVTTLTITGTTSVSITCSAPGFISSTATVECGQFYLFQLALEGGSGGGGGGSTGSCFIATAAYGSESAPEVKFLQGFRDNVLRRTRWGHRFFEELWKYYYRISPPIADEMRRDPELRRVVRWAIVEPWLNYMKLMMARPDFRGMKLEGLDPKLGNFLRQLQADGDKWLKGIEVPRTFKGRDPEEAVHELNVVLGLVLLRTEGRAYLRDLEKRGELPLQYPKVYEGRLRSALEDAGRTEEEITSILHGTSRP